MQREGQRRTDLRRNVCLRSHLTQNEFQSLRARQEERKEVLKAASNKSAQGKAECPSPVRLKEALAAVAKARAQILGAGLQLGISRLPQGLVERQKDMRLDAKCLQNERRSKSLQVYQPPPSPRVKFRRRSYSSDSST